MAKKEKEAKKAKELNPPKRKKGKSFIKEIKELYHPVELVITFITMFGLNFYYYYTVSMNLWMSLFIGTVGLVFFFFVFSYKGKQLERYQSQLNDLLKYVSNMKFFLETGNNVLYSLTAAQKTIADPVIRKDIQKIINKLEEDAVLDTKHFERYDFPALDQFHENLAISYEHGGNPSELFETVQKNMMFEMEKRDELYKKRKSFAMNVYVLLGLVAVIPIILRFIVSNLWEIYLSYEIISNIGLLLPYFAMLLLLRQLQKHKTNISVRI